MADTIIGTGKFWSETNALAAVGSTGTIIVFDHWYFCEGMTAGFTVPTAQ